ncbi:hypothetical protein HNQ72_005145 [Rhizobium wenxiniae]|uniref:Uncharacterized protein n=1 Tax=Rhizobium wenxiniae TaxID=1737357 RepID=A0A7W9YB12_9HYPH|nr:hypothetical protein [Rhizobium wenxiniae]
MSVAFAEPGDFTSPIKECCVAMSPSGRGGRIAHASWAITLRINPSYVVVA